MKVELEHAFFFPGFFICWSTTNLNAYLCFHVWTGVVPVALNKGPPRRSQADGVTIAVASSKPLGCYHAPARMSNKPLIKNALVSSQEVLIRVPDSKAESERRHEAGLGDGIFLFDFLDLMSQ